MLNFQGSQAQANLSADISFQTQLHRGDGVYQQAHQPRLSIGRMLANAILNRVNAALDARGIDFKIQANTQSHKDEKTDDTLIQQLQEPIKHASTPEAVDISTAAIKEGIASGVEETKSRLAQQHALSEDHVQQLEQTQSTLLQDVEVLHTKMKTAQMNQVSGNLTKTVEHSRNLSLELETAEGDNVKIEIDIDHFAQRTTQLAANDGSFTYSKQTNRSSDTAVSFAIEGELNAQEQESLDKFLGQVQQFSERFFADRLGRSTQQGADQLIAAGSDFASFSLDLTQTVSRQTEFNYAAAPEQSLPPVAAPEVTGSGEDPVPTDIESQPAAQALMAEAEAPAAELQRFTNLPEVLSSTFAQLSVEIERTVTMPTLAPELPVADPALLSEDAAPRPADGKEVAA